jgi:hypothetical protein
MITFVLIGLTNDAAAQPPLESVMSYMFCDKEDSTYIVGDTANITVVLKNYLGENETIVNATLAIQTPAELNITQVANFSYDMSGYNSTEYLLNENTTTPICWWNNTYLNMTWAKINPYTLHDFWFTVNCTEEGSFGIEGSTFDYSINNKTKNLEGEGLALTVNAEPTISRLNMPVRGETIWYWWLAGGLLIAIPLITIIIMRITLWKR